jgi:Bardet-Biedl syndrome 4 protein
MAACQVIQKHGDADVALSKYRIVYGRKPECAQVWNNIGMCFFSKKKFVAAVSCLKRANYLAPFELYILYNLALVHLYLQQNASAAIFLQSAIRINRKHAPSYALLGVTLSKLNDPDNALRAYTYSLKLDPTDPMALLNYAIFQRNTGVSQSQIDTTLQQFHQYYAQRAASTNQRELDTSMLDIATKLGTSPPPPQSQLQEKLVQHEEDNVPSSSIFSPGQRYDVKSNDEAAPKQSSKEIPVVKTKIYDDGRHKQRRMKQQPGGGSMQDEELPDSMIV